MKNTINKIKDWNPEKQTAQELLEMINEFKNDPENELKIEELIDFSNLPSSQKYLHGIIIDKFSDYPIWTIDFNGDCLVGDACDEVENISEILKFYREDKINLKHGKVYLEIPHQMNPTAYHLSDDEFLSLLELHDEWGNFYEWVGFHFEDIFTEPKLTEFKKNRNRMLDDNEFDDDGTTDKYYKFIRENITNQDRYEFIGRHLSRFYVFETWEEIEEYILSEDSEYDKVFKECY